MIRPVRDAGLSALIALGLFTPIVGLLTESGSQGLVLRARPIAVVVLVVLVFVGRLLMLSRGIRRAAPKPIDVSPAMQRAGRAIAPALLVFALLLPFGGSRYYVDLATLVLTYIMLGWGLNVVVGLAGLLDLGYVAFYAVGAYSYALLAIHFGLGFWSCLPLAGILASFWGILLGFPVLRLRGDYLAIVTLAFGEIIRIVLVNWVSLTRGPNGITGIPRPTLFGLAFSMEGGEGTFAGFFNVEPQTIQRVIFLYYVILALALITNWFTLRLRRTPLGRAWEALREDETACRSLGINVTNTKLTAFAIGAMFGGFAGAFFATRQAFISPESFTFIESATVLAIVVLGGLGSQLGVALAAIVMVGGLELLRSFLSWLADQMGSELFAGIANELPLYRMLIFGLALVVVMVLRPRRPAVHARANDADGEYALMLSVSGLTMRFGGLKAVDELSFEARAGDITAVIGPNGAGKTTVFNCITGFYRPTEGGIALNHETGAHYALDRMPGHRIASRARVARTFQNVRLFAGMTVLENLLVAQHNVLMHASRFTLGAVLGLRGFRAAQSRGVDKARFWLERMGLVDRADDLAGALPYGAQRRVEIARAMCNDPVLLCLDEPAAGLNPRETEGLNELLRGIRAGGCSLLLIEHDMGVVMRVSDHIIVLDHGRKIADGTPADVRADPAVVAAYLGEGDEGETA